MGNNQKFDVPPHANRGAQNTDRIGLRALVDWFEGTLKFAQVGQDAHREIVSLMGLEYSDFRDVPNGYRKWRKGLRLGSIQVYYDCPTEPSCHVILPGQGCREFEVLSAHDWCGFFRAILSRPFYVSRLDLAIDDFGRIDPKSPGRGVQAYFSVQTLITRIERGLCRSKFEWGRTMGKIKLDDGTYCGKSVYFGSPQSRLQVRVYEKNWERMNKGYELEDGVEVWNRTEVQLRKERAAEAVRLIAVGEKPVGDIVSGILKNYINFVDRDPGDSNKARWKVSRFWAEFLGDVQPLKLALVAPDRTIARVEKWVDYQVEPSLSLLWLANDGRLDWLIEMLEDGCDRLTEKDLEMLDRTKYDYQELVRQRRRQKLEEERTAKLVELKRKPELDEYEMAEADRKQMERRLARKSRNAPTDGTVEGLSKKY